MTPTWTWQTWQTTAYLTCSLLDPWPHGFFTRQTWPQPPQDLTLAIHPEASVFRVKQVHGNQVLSSTEILQHPPAPLEEEPTFPDADGVYSSDRPHEAVWVCSADCTPVLIADTKTGQVAAVHAGWRGTAAKIVPVAIAKLQANGSQIKDLRVAMGPAIAGEVYQVTTAVAAEVGRSILTPNALDLQDELQDEAIVQTLIQHPTPPIFADEKEGHARLDVRQVNAIQLQQMGLELGQIAIAPHCTYQEPERFFSYRRDSRRQVQWSGIVSLPIG